MQSYDFSFVNYVQRVASPAWNIRKSVIDFHDLTFIYKGAAVYTVDEKTYRISAGDVIYIPPGCKRSAHTFSESPMHSFAINLSLPAGQMLPFPTLFHVSMDETLIDLYQKFDKAWLTHDEFRAIRTHALFSLVLCRLKELETTPLSSDKRVERAKEYILTNYYKKTDIKTLAEQAGLNHIYFGTLFKKNTGQTVSEYVNKIRINKAKDLLSDGLKVTDAAILCGFENVFYFSNVFKRLVGISPSEYKRRLR